jgi:hypothetical protein
LKALDYEHLLRVEQRVLAVSEFNLLYEDYTTLAAIVRELAEDCGPPLHPEYGDCAWCEDSYDDLTGKEASDHDESCTWRKAREWAAAHPEGDAP